MYNCLMEQQVILEMVLKLNEQDQVVNSSGYLLDPQITVPANATGISISRTGSVEVTLPGQAQPTNLGNIKFPHSLIRRGWKVLVVIYFWKQLHLVRPQMVIQARMVWGKSVKAISKPPTSMSPKNW